MGDTSLCPIPGEERIVEKVTILDWQDAVLVFGPTVVLLAGLLNLWWGTRLKRRANLRRDARRRIYPMGR